ncbi:MAG: ATP-binding protein [Lewinella sp.]
MKILVTGPESAGKSTVARGLAWALDGLYVEEQARSYLHARGGDYTVDDLPKILDRQIAAERRACATGAAFILCDTGPEVIRVWSEVRFGSLDSAVEIAFRKVRYDLTLLCTPDLPWAYDQLRESSNLEERQEHFDRYRELLPHAAIIDGDHRLEDALAVVLEWIEGAR